MALRFGTTHKPRGRSTLVSDINAQTPFLAPRYQWQQEQALAEQQADISQRGYEANLSALGDARAHDTAMEKLAEDEKEAADKQRVIDTGLGAAGAGLGAASLYHSVYGAPAAAEGLGVAAGAAELGSTAAPGIGGELVAATGTAPTTGFGATVAGGAKTALGAAAKVLPPLAALYGVVKSDQIRDWQEEQFGTTGGGFAHVGTRIAEGAAIGSVIPGVGTVIGAGIGAVTGGVEVGKDWLGEQTGLWGDKDDAPSREEVKTYEKPRAARNQAIERGRALGGDLAAYNANPEQWELLFKFGPEPEGGYTADQRQSVSQWVANAQSKSDDPYNFMTSIGEDMSQKYVNDAKDVMRGEGYASRVSASLASQASQQEEQAGIF